ncbi:MAG: hypothetical protein AB7O94_01105 [Hyphomicrobiaceae bacterium]
MQDRSFGGWGARPVAPIAAATGYIEVLLAKPQERPETARQILAQQQSMAERPIVETVRAHFTRRFHETRKIFVVRDAKPLVVACVSRLTGRKQRAPLLSHPST